MNNTDSAKEFLSMIIKGDIDAAYQRHVDMSGKHHNAFTPAGMEALCAGMKNAHVSFPHKKFDIHQIVAEGDLVAVHSHLTLEKDKPGMTVVHLLRFENGKIVEIWDIAQALPSEEINSDGAF